MQLYIINYNHCSYNNVTTAEGTIKDKMSLIVRCLQCASMAPMRTDQLKQNSRVSHACDIHAG